MIKDKIENYALYSVLSGKIAQAFDYIHRTDLKQIPAGRYDIDGDHIFALVSEYETRDKSECKFEGHHRYIDLQYVISGTELIGIETLRNQVPVETNEEKDYDLYDLESDFIQFNSGMFMIFFPDDLHMPGISSNHASRIKKVVIKIKVD